MAAKLGCQPMAVTAAVRHLAQQVRELKKQLASGSRQPPALAPFDATIPMGHPTSAQIKSALRDSARMLNVAPFDAPARVTAMLVEVQELKEQLAELAKSGSLSAESLLEKAEMIGGAKVIIAEAPGANANLMRQLIDQVRKKASPSAVFLATTEGEGKVVLVAGITRDLVEKGLSAGNWVRDVAPIVGGGGGGKPDLAQAGGKHPEKLDEALAKAREVAKGLLAG
jgi:alanyl-tRNA synthetase